MGVIVKIQDVAGNELGSFGAEDGKSLLDLAAMHGIEVPIACGAGICGICLCHVEEGATYIQEDKITTPALDMKKDEAGNPLEVLSCVAGIKSEFFTDENEHIVTLRKAY